MSSSHQNTNRLTHEECTKLKMLVSQILQLMHHKALLSNISKVRTVFQTILNCLSESGAFLPNIRQGYKPRWSYSQMLD
jgi:hypothetical protein